MKKIILGIVTVVAATTGYCLASSASSTPAMVNPHDHDCHGMRCTLCNGTGFNGMFDCSRCKGTGRIGSY